MCSRSFFCIHSVVAFGVRHFDFSSFSGGFGSIGCFNGCAIGFGLSHKVQLEDDIVRNEEAARARGDAFDADAAREIAFSSMEELNFDDGGRFFLPPDIKDFSTIGDVIMFLGVGRYIQMWKPEAYLDYAAGREVIKARIRKFLAEREAGAK